MKQHWCLFKQNSAVCLYVTRCHYIILNNSIIIILTLIVPEVEIRDQVTSVVWFWWGIASWLAGSAFLHTHSAFPKCVLTESASLLIYSPTPKIGCSITQAGLKLAMGWRWSWTSEPPASWVLGLQRYVRTLSLFCTGQWSPLFVLSKHFTCHTPRFFI